MSVGAASDPVVPPPAPRADSAAVRTGLVLLSAGLGILAFPPFHLPALGLVFPLPFLLAIRHAKPGQAVLLGLVHGLALFIGTLHWLLTVFGPFALLLHVILALFPAIFAGLLTTLRPHLPSPRWQPWVAAILWTGIEHFRSEWFGLRFPWITPGTALPPGHLTPIVGVYGISFLIIAACAALSFGPENRRTAAALLAGLALATWLPLPPSPETGLRIAAIQVEDMSVPRLLQLSEKIEQADAIVWPEYAIGFDPRENPAFLDQVRQLLRSKKASILVLGGRVDHGPELWENTAFTIGLDGVLGTHVKNRPVHFFNDGRAGTDAPSIPTPLGPLATTICFDNDYAAVPRRAVARGAGFLLIPSMDAAHWTTTQHLQHAELFRHRAAENGRYLVVAATSGLTQGVDDRGRRIAALPLYDPGILETRISPRSHRTLYQRGGWLIGPACSIIAALLMIHAVIVARKKGAPRA